MKILILGLICLQTGITVGELINWKEYLNDVTRRVIHLLEEKQITGNGMPMWDFENEINSKSMYGVRVDGRIKFHSGFVAKISAASLISTSYKHSNSDTQSTLYAQLGLKGMSIFYDIIYDLTEYQATGNLVLWLPETVFDMNIRKNLQTNAITGSLAYLTTGNQNLMKVQVYPDNGYTQLTARELKQVIAFRQNMTDAFKTWDSTMWQDLLDVALLEVPFPQMCYYCP